MWLSAWTASAADPKANGFKVGEGRLHPFVELEARVDSAAGMFGDPANPTLNPEIINHFRPGLKLDWPTRTAEVNLSGNLDYVWYTGLLTHGSSNASRLEAAANLDAAFNRRGTVEFDVADRFTRSDRTVTPVLGVGILSLFNELSAGVPIHPGGGALEVAPKGAWAFESFSAISNLAVPGCQDPSCDPSAVQSMNYQNFRFGVDGRWKFLPKTAVLLESDYSMRQYEGGTNLPAQLLRARLGVAGLLTGKVAVTAKLGWGHDFSSSRAKTLVAHAELSYLPTQTVTAKVGYLRTLEPVPAFGVYRDDRAYGEVRAIFLGKLTIHGYAAYDVLSYYGGAARRDSNVTVDVGPEYQFKPWLVGALGYVLGARGSVGSEAATVNFTRNEGYLRVTFIY